MDRHTAPLLDDILAEKLLPQARIVVRMESARKEKIHEGLLGKLQEVSLVEEANSMEEVVIDEVKPLKFPEPEELIPAFMEALNRGDKCGVLSLLQDILNAVEWELVRTDLPPVAPKYFNPE